MNMDEQLDKEIALEESNIVYRSILESDVLTSIAILSSLISRSNFFFSISISANCLFSSSICLSSSSMRSASRKAKENYAIQYSLIYKINCSLISFSAAGGKKYHIIITAYGNMNGHLLITSGFAYQ